MPEEIAERDRRQRLAFRALVQEMLNRIRDASRENEGWTPEERARAEADLERIMSAVRTEAMSPEGSDAK